MYNNLKNVLYRKNISIKQYSEFLGITEKITRNKLKGVTDFIYKEFKKTCLIILNEYNAEFLFRVVEGKGSNERDVETKKPLIKRLKGMVK